jgi:uncharacterized OsmC-like protein
MAGWHTQQGTVRSFEIGGEEVMRPFTMDIDEPLQLGGSDTNPNPNPQEYLLAALNVCMISRLRRALCA